MNSAIVLTAIQSFIRDRAATITAGISLQGAAQLLQRITIAPYVYPYNYPFIRINLMTARTATNTTFPATDYDVMLEVCWVAYQQQNDPLPYELHQVEFNKLTDRICSAFAEVTKICGGTVCFALSSEITKVNISGLLANSHQPMLGMEIMFSVQDC